MGKLTDERLIQDLMNDYGFSREETINGYGIFADSDGGTRIERIDDLYFDNRHNYEIEDDVDAYIQAINDGIIQASNDDIKF